MVRRLDVRFDREKNYFLNPGMVRTPPMIPESIPKSIPPQQAFL
jgi:hypothetical protein